MIQNGQIQSLPFEKWVWKLKKIRLVLILMLVSILVQFIWFKYLYPYPSFIPDSYSYIEAALNNEYVSIRPIGYSKFLQLFHMVSSSHRALVLFQYFLLQIGIFYLLLSLDYLFILQPRILKILIVCNTLNPLLFYVSNLLSSDALFTGLSLIWFTQLLWILHQPSMHLVISHAIILFLAFAMRYNALYYPLISIGVLTLSRTKWRIQITGTLLIIILIGMLVAETMGNYRLITGKTQFSAFGGWQLASNALFSYSRVIVSEPEQVPAKFSQLHCTVKKHMDSLRQLKNRPDSVLGPYYLWDEQAPLKKYMNDVYSNDNTSSFIQRWASMGPLYTEYGSWLIWNHPTAFMKYYLWPNARDYYSPATEFLNAYNMDSDNIEPIAMFWFKLKTTKVYTHLEDKGIIVTILFPPIFAAINILFIFSLIGYLILDGFKKESSSFNRFLFLAFSVWLCNFCFSILASPIVLRYQVFPMIIIFSFSILLVVVILKQSKTAMDKNNLITQEWTHRRAPDLNY